MFGRNPNAFHSSNAFPQSNPMIFVPNVYQQSNIFNFQYNNQPIFNNTYQNQPLIPNTNQPYQQNMTQNSNHQANFPDFDQFLHDAEEYTDNSIANSSKNKYQSNLNVY